MKITHNGRWTEQEFVFCPYQITLLYICCKINSHYSIVIIFFVNSVFFWNCIPYSVVSISSCNLSIVFVLVYLICVCITIVFVYTYTCLIALSVCRRECPCLKVLQSQLLKFLEKLINVSLSVTKRTANNR